VVRRFSLADILLVNRLQGQVACLDLETALLWSPAPLPLAVLEFLSLNMSRTTTFVQNRSSTDGATQGFLQAWDRSDRLSCDVAFVAPSLDGSAATADIWQDLLEYLARIKGESGVQRIFATIPESGPASEVFRQAGFNAYAGRQVLRLERIPRGLAAAPSSRCHPAGEHDGEAFQRLRSSLTPRPVQHAEGTGQARRDPTAILPWWKSRENKEWVWTENGGIKAYLRTVVGEEGHWLRILLEPGDAGRADAILNDALCLLASYPPRPVYCAVREYEAGVQGALNALGFEHVASELLMVKHTTVRKRVPVGKLSPALEKGVETAAPISTSSRYPDQA
jgi:hypothetical protein